MHGVSFMPVTQHDLGAIAGPPTPSLAVENVMDSIGREQIAVAARLLRTIAVTDGDIEILLHEMARALERIADADGCRCGSRATSLTMRYAWGVARI